MKNIFSKMVLVLILLGAFLQAGNVRHYVPEDTGLLVGGEFHSHTMYVKNESTVNINISEGIIDFIEEIYLHKHSHQMSEQEKIFPRGENISTEMIFDIENNNISETYFIMVKIKKEGVPVGTEITVNAQVGARFTVGRTINIQSTPSFTFDDLKEGVDFRIPDLINDYNITIKIEKDGFIDIYNNDTEARLLLNGELVHRRGIFPVSRDDTLVIKVPDLQIIGEIGSQLYMQFKSLEDDFHRVSNSELVEDIIEELHDEFDDYDYEIASSLLRLSLYVREFGFDGDGFEILTDNLLSIDSDILILGYNKESIIDTYRRLPKIRITVKDADDQNVNFDTDGVEIAQIELDTYESSDNIEVKKMNLRMTVDSNSASVYDITNCQLFYGSDSVSNRKDAAALVQFYIDIEAEIGAKKSLSLKCEIGDEFEHGDTITVSGVSFEAEGLVSDIDIEDGIEGQTSVEITVGEIILSLSSDDINNDRIALMDTNSISIGIYEFKARNNSFTIDEIDVVFKHTVEGVIDGNVDLYVSGIKVSTAEVQEDGDLDLFFMDLSIDVDRDEIVQLEFKVDSSNSGNIQIDSISVETENGEDVEIETDGPLVRVVEAIPVVTKVNVDTNYLETDNDVNIFTYKVKAEGGDINLGKNIFNVRTENILLGNLRVVVYNNASMTGSSVVEKYVNLNNGNVFVDLSNILIAENDTYFITLISDTTITDTYRIIQTEMQDREFSWDGIVGQGSTFGDIDGTLLLEDDIKSTLIGDADSMTKEETAAILIPTVYLPMLLN